jgi:hypothetical protein
MLTVTIQNITAVFYVNVVMLTVTIKNITAVFYAKCLYADCHN